MTDHPIPGAPLMDYLTEIERQLMRVAEGLMYSELDGPDLAMTRLAVDAAGNVVGVKEQLAEYGYEDAVLTDRPRPGARVVLPPPTAVKFRPGRLVPHHPNDEETS